MSHSNQNLESRLRKIIENNTYKEPTPLCEVIRKNGSDKCSSWHNYTPIYTEILKDSPSDLSLFELGLYHGCSIKSWADYFPKGKIFGADINPDYLVNERNIKTFICDQNSELSIKELWKNIPNESFDIMIDDGQHEFHSNYTFFINSINVLKPGGVFIIEDLTTSCFSSFEKITEVIKQNFGLKESFVLDIPNDNNQIDNRMFIAVR